MNALVYHGPGKKSWDAVPDPVIQKATDAIVSIDTATICGTDLHILKGDVPETKRGTILGHEAVGTIVEVGSAVTTHRFALADVMAGYDAFAAAATTGALKVTLKRAAIVLQPVKKERVGAGARWI
jgi:threonine dehydrogenase-like Zn-dependent dehydrogenase